MERDSEKLVIDTYLTTVVEAANLLKKLVDIYKEGKIDTPAFQYNIAYYFKTNSDLMVTGSEEGGYTWLNTINRICGARRVNMIAKVLRDQNIIVK